MTKACGVFGASALILLIIFSCNLCLAAQNEESELYNVYSHATSNRESPPLIVKLRAKRQSTDAKNQYESVSQNATDTMQKQQPPTPASNVSIVVPYQPSDRLLGVNGTGQRKDMATVPLQQQQPLLTTITTAEQLPTTNATNNIAKNPQQSILMKKLQPAGAKDYADMGGDTDKDTLIDDVDVPEDKLNEEIGKNKYQLKEDGHTYYNSTMYVNKEEADSIWNQIKNTPPNAMLSQSHRRAMTVESTFDFPFYGHPVRNITVATGGFLYTGEYVHSWLAATQYIAALMANFDTSLSNDSFVRINDNGTAFTVIWENVSLQDKQDVGKFTFSTTLHKTGDIVFVYYNVPINVNAIHDDKHPVKVGLSDAYIIDKTIYYARRKTIYEYHRINFGGTDIGNSTIIRLRPLPTCLNYTDCESCSNHNTTFDCAWCPSMNRCSTGTDRKKQEWLNKGCDRTQISDAASCPALGQPGNNAQQINNQTSSNNTNTPPAPSSPSNTNNNNSENKKTEDPVQGQNEKEKAAVKPVDGNDNVGDVVKRAESLAAQNNSKSMGLALGFLVPICLVLTVVMWVLYAYRNPHTKSGQLLIQYRPSTWSWRRGEARYTAATIHM